MTFSWRPCRPSDGALPGSRSARGGLGAGTRAAYDLVRADCAFVELDRELDTDLQVLEALVQSGALTAVLD